MTVKRFLFAVGGVILGAIAGILIGSLVGYFIPTLLGATPNEAMEIERGLGKLTMLGGAVWGGVRGFKRGGRTRDAKEAPAS